MQQWIRSYEQKLFLRMPITLVTLTLPDPLVTFRLEALFFVAFNWGGEREAGPFRR